MSLEVSIEQLVEEMLHSVRIDRIMYMGDVSPEHAALNAMYRMISVDMSDEQFGSLIRKFLIKFDEWGERNTE